MLASRDAFISAKRRGDPAYFRQGKDVINDDAPDRAERHIAELRIVGILNQGKSTVPLDLQKPSGAVVEHAGEDDANDSWSKIVSRRAKQRVHGRAVQVFCRPPAEGDSSVVAQQMMVGRRDIDAASLDLVAIARLEHRHRRLAAPYSGKVAHESGPEVENDEDRRGKIGGEIMKQFPDGFDASGGGANDYDVTLHFSPAFRALGKQFGTKFLEGAKMTRPLAGEWMRCGCNVLVTIAPAPLRREGVRWELAADSAKDLWSSARDDSGKITVSLLQARLCLFAAP